MLAVLASHSSERVKCINEIIPSQTWPWCRNVALPTWQIRKWTSREEGVEAGLATGGRLAPGSQPLHHTARPWHPHPCHSRLSSLPGTDCRGGFLEKEGWCWNKTLKLRGGWYWEEERALQKTGYRKRKRKGVLVAYGGDQSDSVPPFSSYFCFITAGTLQATWENLAWPAHHHPSSTSSFSLAIFQAVLPQMHCGLAALGCICCSSTGKASTSFPFISPHFYFFF